MRLTGGFLRVLAAATRQRSRRGLPRKLRKHPRPDRAGRVRRPSPRAGWQGVEPSRQNPLLVIGPATRFAHRLRIPCTLPKTIRCSDGKGAGAIVGFANFLLRFYADERPRAVIVGWDSLDAPTKRHEMFPAYQSGREFDEELIEQLNVLPDFVARRFGFANAKSPGVRSRRLSRRRGCCWRNAQAESALVASGGSRSSFSSPRHVQ